jgi:hypothetical protein
LSADVAMISAVIARASAAYAFIIFTYERDALRGMQMSKTQ